MPKITMENHAIGGGFGFQGARIDSLGAAEYTLVTIAVDVTGSTAHFSDELHRCLVASVTACRKAPSPENLLIRVLTFSSAVGGVNEVHGFKPLADIDESSDYPQFVPRGMTPLYDATYSAVGATVAYGKDLMDNDYMANGIVFVITDGYDTDSTATPAMIKKQIEKTIGEEQLESIVTLLIGINAQQYQAQLDDFKNKAGIDKYIDAGDANDATLAKLTDFVLHSVSSQSQSLGQGGPSQNISATI